MYATAGTEAIHNGSYLKINAKVYIDDFTSIRTITSKYDLSLPGSPREFLIYVYTNRKMLVAFVNAAGTGEFKYPNILLDVGYNDIEIEFDAGTVTVTINGNTEVLNYAITDIALSDAPLRIGTWLSGGSVVNDTLVGVLYYLAVGYAEFNFAEGDGTTLYNTGTAGGDAALTGATLPDCWANTQDEYHYNINNGFDLYEDGSGNKLRVPIGATVSEAGFSLVRSHPAGKFHNLAETKMKLPADTALESICSGLTTNIFYSAPATPSVFHPEDLSGAFDLENLHKIFFMIDEKKAFQLLFYSTAKTEDEIQKILKCGTKKYILPDGYIFWKDSNGLYLRDVNGVLLFLEA